MKLSGLIFALQELARENGGDMPVFVYVEEQGKYKDLFPRVRKLTEEMLKDKVFFGRALREYNLKQVGDRFIEL